MSSVSSVAASFRSQYRAALAMLEECIDRCPDHAWNDASEGNRYWHIAYHALFYTALYCSQEEEPVLWEGCIPYHQLMSTAEWAPGYDPQQAKVYSPAELREFISWLSNRLDLCFNDASIELPSRFSWIPFSRFELYIYNLRHLQHHTGQLAERLKRYTAQGAEWVGWR